MPFLLHMTTEYSSMGHLCLLTPNLTYTGSKDPTYVWVNADGVFGNVEDVGKGLIKVEISAHNGGPSASNKVEAATTSTLAKLSSCILYPSCGSLVPYY